MLALKTNGRALGECGSVLTHSTVAEIGSIKLHSRLRGVNLQCATALRLRHLGSKTQLTFFFLVQYVVVVVTRTILYLLVVGINLQSESLGLTEVERRALHLEDFTRGNAGIVDWEIEIGVDLANLLFNGRSGICDACQ